MALYSTYKTKYEDEYNSAVLEQWKTCVKKANCN